MYGATGAMRVWSGIFSRLPSKPLEVGNEGLDWQWVSGRNATDASCPGARRFAFVQGYAPAYEPCVIAPPPAAVDEFGNPIEPIESDQPESGNGFWRDLFGGRPPRDPATTPPPAPQPPAPQPSR